MLEYRVQRLDYAEIDALERRARAQRDALIARGLVRCGKALARLPAFAAQSIHAWYGGARRETRSPT